MLVRRLRRNRKTPAIRELISETRLVASQLIYPLFVTEGPTRKTPLLTQHNLTDLFFQVEKALCLGIKAIALFPIIDPSLKDPLGQEAVACDNLLHRTVRSVKKRFPNLCVMTDVALDPYTTSGHDGFFDHDTQTVLNDETVDYLAEMALQQACAGSDMVAPSDMMDGRVRAIRKKLDENGFESVSIHAYAVKYASALYGPFRDTVGSKLQAGDKKDYQMSPTNAREAILEATTDANEGADILMVKPASYYLDVIYRLRTSTYLPISAYQVSGEYAMIKAAAAKGWLDEKQAVIESLIAIKRAGADMILSYAALDVATWISKGMLDA